jgi:hypothetical protein
MRSRFALCGVLCAGCTGAGGGGDGDPKPLTSEPLCADLRQVGTLPFAKLSREEICDVIYAALGTEIDGPRPGFYPPVARVMTDQILTNPAAFPLVTITVEGDVVHLVNEHYVETYCDSAKPWGVRGETSVRNPTNSTAIPYQSDLATEYRFMPMDIDCSHLGQRTWTTAGVITFSPSSDGTDVEACVLPPQEEWTYYLHRRHCVGASCRLTAAVVEFHCQANGSPSCHGEPEAAGMAYAEPTSLDLPTTLVLHGAGRLDVQLSVDAKGQRITTYQIDGTATAGSCE